MDSLFANILLFILSLYSDSYYPRKIVQEFVEYFNQFIINFFLPSLKKEIFQILEDEKVNDSTYRRLNAIFMKYSKTFEPFLTEHKRFNLLKTIGFLDYEEIWIAHYFKKIVIDERIQFLPESIYGIHVPLRHSLKSFLEIPGLFEQILIYIRKLRSQSEIITNIMQAKLWVENYSRKFVNEFVLPLYIFYDDLEVGNALGSHSGTNKFGAIYAIIACLPPHISSRLNSILFTTLFHTEDKKKTDNQHIFQHLVNELTFLRYEGIKLIIDNMTVKVKFQLVLILGDNLGLNGIMGFIESFKTSYCCRLCKMTSLQMQFAVQEDATLLRNKSNYEDDSKLIITEKSGLKEKCIFHNVPDFHLTINLSVDMMHDVLEGVCQYVMKSLLRVFIHEKNYFSLDVLNCLIEKFDFESNECSNKPPPIKPHRLKDKKVQLSMSAAEMLCFVRYFGLIAGHLIPECDEHYKLYQYLRQIIDIVTSPRIVKGHAAVLEILIKKHNLLFIKLFGPLKPKFHYLIHYPRLLLTNGPFINYWSMRCESRHRELKANTQATFNTKNLLKTIATKQLLKMCYTNNTLKCDNNPVFISEMPILQNVLSLMCERSMDCKFFREVQVSGLSYRIDMFIVIGLDIKKEFGKILHVINNNGDLSFHVSVYEEYVFNYHYHAYEIISKKIEKIITFKNLAIKNPCLSAKINDIYYVSARHVL